jgi:hypothetical protein
MAIRKGYLHRSESGSPFYLGVWIKVEQKNSSSPRERSERGVFVQIFAASGARSRSKDASRLS